MQMHGMCMTTAMHGHDSLSLRCAHAITNVLVEEGVLAEPHMQARHTLSSWHHTRLHFSPKPATCVQR